MPELNEYLIATPTIESDHPEVLEFTQSNCQTSDSLCKQATSLFRAVRDAIRYDTYRVDISIDGLKATTSLKHRYGWCVPKAVLLAACCRAIGIPARLGFADVRNHLSTERLRRHMQTDVFVWHAYCSIYLNDRWIKATPAFNMELCRRFRLTPLEFDGESDALLLPFDAEGNRHMEYIAFRGEYADVPIDQIRDTFHREYPFFRQLAKSEDFEEDVRRETSLEDE